MTEHIVPTFPDERFSPLETSGLVDCFICGRKVSILDSFKLACSATPTGHMHRGCLNSMPSTAALWELYHQNVIGAVRNLHPTIPALTGR